MSARRMLALIQGLPEDAAALRPDRPGWTQQDELLATNVELLDLVGRLLMYWLQVVAAPQYRHLRAEMPRPFIERFRHPDRPEPQQREREKTLPPRLTPELAKQMGFM